MPVLQLTERSYSPIGRGILTGEIQKPEDIPQSDMRSHMPRFQGENFEKNLELVRKLQDFAKQKGCTPAQLALSVSVSAVEYQSMAHADTLQWVRHLSKKDGNPEIIPIPGATKVERILENAKDFPLTPEESATIDTILQGFEVAGSRYGGPQAELMEG